MTDTAPTTEAVSTEPDSALAELKRQFAADNAALGAELDAEAKTATPAPVGDAAHPPATVCTRADPRPDAELHEGTMTTEGVDSPVCSSCGKHIEP